MKPAPFDYKKVSTLSEALEAYGNDDERELRLLAGGQSLVPMMNLRLARPGVLIDLNKIEELNYVSDSGDSIEIGAITRLRSVETDEQIVTSVPLLREAISYVAHTAIRTRGTIGGNVAHADPSAEIPTVLVALGGEIVASSSNGDRTIAAKDFFLGAFFTELDEREIIKLIRIPKEPENSGSAFVEFAPRHGDFAIVGIAAVISQNDSGHVDSVRLVVAGVDGKPLDVSSEADSLIGKENVTLDSFDEVAQNVFKRVEPSGDIHASADYRRELSQTLTVKALNLAWKRLGGSNE